MTAKFLQYAGVPHCDARVDIQLVPGVALHGHVSARRVPLGLRWAPAPHRLDGPGTFISLYSLHYWMTIISSEPDSGQGDADTGARGG